MIKTISIILPIYNEEDNVDELISRLKITENQLKDDYIFDYIFINDCSIDSSFNKLLEYSSRFTNIKVISFSRNFGQQLAFKAGYDNCNGDFIITMDSDLQDPPELILDLIKKIEKGFDIIYARRKDRHEGFFKKVTADIYYKIINKFSDVKIPKNVGDFRIINSKVLNEIKKINQKDLYIRGAIANMGFKFDFLDFDRHNRISGKTNYNISKMIKLALDGIINYTEIPLKIIKWVAILSFLSGFFGLIMMLYLDIFQNKYFPTWSYIIVFLFIFNSFNFSIFWLIGQYLKRILNQKSTDYLYIIDKKINF